MYENPALSLNVYASLARKWILPFRGRSGGTAHQAFICQKGVCHCNQRWKQHRWFQRAGWAASSCRGDWVTSFFRKMYVNVRRSTSPETSQWEKCGNMAACLWHLAKFYMLMFTNSVVLTFILFIMEWRFWKYHQRLHCLNSVTVYRQSTGCRSPLAFSLFYFLTKMFSASLLRFWVLKMVIMTHPWSVMCANWLFTNNFGAGLRSDICLKAVFWWPLLHRDV